MDLLAFMSVPLVALRSFDAATEPQLPVFKPLPWFRDDRLDARPVAWSLRNRPDDWDEATPGYTIRHKPSDHTFWIWNGKGYYSLYAADCSCTTRSDRGRFQRFQQGIFHRAYRHWLRHRPPPVDAEQFAAHFVR